MKLEKIIEKAGLEQFNWTKTVEALDKSLRGGYSIVGEFTKDTDLQDGLYLSVDKGSYDYYCLYKISNDDLNIIKIFENDHKSWAKEFWDDIEENLDESLAEKLYNHIMDKTSRLEDLEELQKLLNKKIGEVRENNGVESFDMNEVFDVTEISEEVVDEFESKFKKQVKKMDKKTRKEQTLLYAICKKNLDGDIEEFSKYAADIETFPCFMFADSLKDFGNVKPKIISFNGKGCAFTIDPVKKSFMVRFSSR